MEKIYYKGNLINFNNVKNLYFNYDATKEADFSNEEAESLHRIIKNHFMYDKKIEEEITDEIAIKKLSNLSLLPHSDNLLKETIIFEIIEDENGIKFGKEIYTKKLFPLIDEKNIKKSFFLTKVGVDNSHISHYYSASVGLRNYEYTIKTIFNITNNVIVSAKIILYNPICNVANQNEINDYLSKFKTHKLFSKNEKENKKKINEIINLSNENVFKNEIIEKKEEKKEREQQDKLTLHMEKIEYLLLKLDKINHNIKEEKQEKYNKLLNDYDNSLTTSPLNTETLKMLEAEIEFAIKYNSKSENNILDTLDNIIDEYNTSNTTNRTINDIDELVRLFLQMKTNYSPIVQRNVIEKFALIYIYEIYENKDEITIEQLKDSYINDILTSILICLNKMIDNNEIENNIIIKLEGDITIDYIINCIKEIKFIKNKELIKK